LFYTDGITVFNKNHTIMLNGMGLNEDTYLMRFTSYLALSYLLHRVL